ncbi:MAG: AraC family transcriptional regulator [Stellaceae bacterium]
MSILRTSALMGDPDTAAGPVVAVVVNAPEASSECRMHRHNEAQLVMAVRGAITCEVPNGLWIVPPRCGIWIPGNVPHSNSISADGTLCLLYVRSAAVPLPTECCTLRVSPLLREMILRLAELPQVYDADWPIGRLAGALLDELTQMPTKQLRLPITGDQRLRRIADMLLKDPSDRSTMAQWAKRVAMSERTLGRLIVTETGMSFGRWRQQLHIIIALQRLAAGHAVQTVSQDLGYESVSAFITMFKKALGKSPGRYLAERARWAPEDEAGPVGRYELRLPFGSGGDQATRPAR